MMDAAMIDDDLRSVLFSPRHLKQDVPAAVEINAAWYMHMMMRSGVNVDDIGSDDVQEVWMPLHDGMTEVTFRKYGFFSPSKVIDIICLTGGRFVVSHEDNDGARTFSRVENMAELADQIDIFRVERTRLF